MPCLAMILDQSWYSHPPTSSSRMTRLLGTGEIHLWWGDQTPPADPGARIDVNTCSQKRMA
jgi:hypothetical protein